MKDEIDEGCVGQMKKKNGVIKGRTMSARERERCVTDTERMREQAQSGAGT